MILDPTFPKEEADPTFQNGEADPTVENHSVRRRKTYAGAGILLTRLDADEPRFLLLCGRDSDIWSFPKGHPEVCDGRTPLRTAVRETYEETGYVASRDYTIYGSAMRFGKRPYWIGILHPNAQPTRLSAREHRCARWFSYDEIVNIKTNSDVRDWQLRNGPSSQFHATLSSAISAKRSTHLSAPECSAS
jgi:8-oxo-dGTP pyrophosphatase MutT (NUDIX family)